MQLLSSMEAGSRFGLVELFSEWRIQRMVPFYIIVKQSLIIVNDLQNKIKTQVAP